MRKRTILILAVLLLLLVSGAIYFLLMYYAAVTRPPPMNITPGLECKILDSGVLDYGKYDKIIYLLTQINGRDVKGVNVTVNLYPREVPSDIYLLDYSSPTTKGCYECNGFGDFRKSLEKNLKNYDLIDVNSTLNQIKIYQLDKLTRRSIIIVPTGKIPSQLVGLENGSDLNELMKKGSVVIFIGSDLDESLNSTGQIVNIPDNQLGKYGISYQKRMPPTCPETYKFKKPRFQHIEQCLLLHVIRKQGGGLFHSIPQEH